MGFSWGSENDQREDVLKTLCKLIGQSKTIKIRKHCAIFQVNVKNYREKICGLGSLKWWNGPLSFQIISNPSPAFYHELRYYGSNEHLKGPSHIYKIMEVFQSIYKNMASLFLKLILFWDKYVSNTWKSLVILYLTPTMCPQPFWGSRHKGLGRKWMWYLLQWNT